MDKNVKRERIIPDLKGVTIFQSNNVTNAKHDYTLIQLRVFAFIMYNMQAEISQVMSGARITQLDIFKKQDSSMLAMIIPLHHLGSPTQYRDIRAAINEMMGVRVVIKTLDKNELKWGGLISAASVPNKELHKNSGKVMIEIRRDVAETLVNIDYKQDKNKNWRPEQYTRYMLYVALEAKVKYSIKLYQVLCSYKERRIFPCSIDDLRDLLSIPAGTYKNFADLKRYVLDPVARELKQIADIFFDTDHADFIQRVGRKVVALKFYIEYPVTEKLYDRNKSKLIKELIDTFGCREQHINELLPYLIPEVSWTKIDAVVARCYYMCNKGLVDHPAAFIKKSLITELTPV